MAKIRVYELAKEMEVSSKDLVQALLQGGIEVKNHMSTMEESQVAWVRRHYKNGVLEMESKPLVKETPAPTSKPPQPKVDQDQRTSQPDTRKTVTPAFKSPDPAVRPQPGKTPAAKPSSTGIPSDIPTSSSVGQHPAPPKPTSTSGQAVSRPAPVQPRPGTSPRPAGTQRGPGAPVRPSSNNGAPHTSSRPSEDRRQQSSTTNATTGSQRGPGGPPRPAQGQRGPGGPPRPAQGQRGPGGPRPAQGQSSPGNPTRPNQDKRGFGENRAVPASGNHQKNAAGSKNQYGKNKTNTFNQPRDYSRPGRKSKPKKKREEIVRLPEKISVPDTLQVREFAELLFKPSAEIMKKLMELGIMATINQQIDYDTIEILSGLYGVEVERELTREEKILEQIIDSEESLQKRPPIVTVMGHVDHGKTSLLDWVRRSNVVSGEAGGITQHIGAYQVKVNNELITFIDTPGHEAFTAMRARGANLTDIVVLVVAADDGVMPQTVEAINHIKAAGVPFIVALNKMDKPDINPERVKQQLTEYSIVPEDWGGDTVFVPVSAKTGMGMEQLLEMVLLISEMHDIKANPDRYAEGVIVESRLDKGKGPIATVLVQKGTMRAGDYIISGVNWCKVRSMVDDKGRRLDYALPSTPVEITGWSDVPEAGEKVQVVDEKVAKEVSALRITDKKLEDQKKSSRVTLDDFFRHMKDTGMKELNLIIKGDVQGSVEALSQSLFKLSTDEVKVCVIHMAVGAIKEADVMLASASNAIIIGFNVRPDVNARQYAENESIDIRLYRIIYEVIEDVKKAMVGLLDPEYKEKYLGRAEVRQVIRVPNIGSIAGSYVIEGKLQRNAKARVLRDGVIVYEGSLSSLKRFKDDVKEVMENFECGIGIKDFNDIKESDIIEAFVMEEIPRTLG